MGIGSVEDAGRVDTVVDVCRWKTGTMSLQAALDTCSVVIGA